MTRDNENKLRKLLEFKREELRRAIEALRERAFIEQSSDPVDRVRGLAERELVIRGINRMSVLLRLAEGALQEMSDGTFGVCARCGNEIPLKRLRAVPWSPYCVHCQEVAENTEVNDENAGSESAYAGAT
jgi:DnaK suppressor protein